MAFSQFEFDSFLTFLTLAVANFFCDICFSLCAGRLLGGDGRGPLGGWRRSGGQLDPRLRRRRRRGREGIQPRRRRGCHQPFGFFRLQVCHEKKAQMSIDFFSKSVVLLCTDPPLLPTTLPRPTATTTTTTTPWRWTARRTR